ncbi:hypothetical protein EVAR_81854_1 [Eumeta japonica]|uniref:Uncharacterized protein n=1 Tax=Eumeta variegata TaxID=151549 RepID=A0A4C2A1A7_EUMVA|nr:hypothetical protein EVAR_81854_1 [Eumeta japonica]
MPFHRAPGPGGFKTDAQKLEKEPISKLMDCIDGWANASFCTDTAKTSKFQPYTDSSHSQGYGFCVLSTQQHNINYRKLPGKQRIGGQVQNHYRNEKICSTRCTAGIDPTINVVQPIRLRHTEEFDNELAGHIQILAIQKRLICSKLSGGTGSRAHQSSVGGRQCMQILQEIGPEIIRNACCLPTKNSRTKPNTSESFSIERCPWRNHQIEHQYMMDLKSTGGFSRRLGAKTIREMLDQDPWNVRALYLHTTCSKQSKKLQNACCDRPGGLSGWPLIEPECTRHSAYNSSLFDHRIREIEYVCKRE